MKLFISAFTAFVLIFASAASYAIDDEFKPAYQNIDSYDLDESDKLFVRHKGRNYYTSGKDAGDNTIRVNENNEESTDETVGILTFLIAPAAIVYMNLTGWWE